MKQEIEFIKFNPTQNMTVLVKTSHPAEEYQHIASSIMSYDHVYAEQVGFIVPSLQRGAAARLQMAGGSFVVMPVWLWQPTLHLNRSRVLEITLNCCLRYRVQSS